MGFFKELLEIYKTLLYTKVEEPEIEEVYIKDKPVRPEEVEPQKAEEVESPEEGDVIEIVPPYDGFEMKFLVARKINGHFEIVPLSRFYEFATPYDVVFILNGETYIAQTDLALTVPEEKFSKRFGNRFLFKEGKVDRELLERIIRVLDGKEKGDGKIMTEEQKEFKKIESKRWFSVFMAQIEEEEILEELNSFLKELKAENLALAASEQEKTWGEKEGLRWFYDENAEQLIIVPSEEMVGKRKRIILKTEHEEFTIFEGYLPEKIEIPLEKEAYSHGILKRFLEVEDA